MVQLVLRSRISVGEVKELARRLEEGALDPKALVEALKTAAAEERLENWIEQFRSSIP